MTRSLLLSILCLMVPVVGALSQSAVQDTTRSRSLQEVEVRGTGSQRVVASTSPLHVLGQRQMLRMGIGDMADALHRLPGITLRDYGGAGGMKTVSVRGFGTAHTGVSYDGVMLSDCQNGEIDLSRYSLDNVARLQLAIGDNEDIFQPARQAAHPAVLAIETLRRPSPSDSLMHLTAQMRVGSFGYASPFVKYEQNLTPRLSLSAIGEYVYAENDYPYTLQNGEQTVKARRSNSRMNQGHAELNLGWRPDSQQLVALKGYYYDNDRQLPGQVRYYNTLSGETLRDRNAFVQASYLLRPAGKWALRAMGKFNWASSSYRDALYPEGVRDADYWQREAYAAACVLYTPTDQWSLDYSADYGFNNLNSSLATDARPFRHTVLQSLSTRFQTRGLTVVGRLLASLYLNGSRLGTSARDMRRLSPSLSVSYQPLASHRLFLRASYKDIFRAPTFNESYFFHYGSTDLAPESTQQVNVGITCATPLWRQSMLTLTLDAYHNQVKDKIVAVPYNMFIWRCVNVGKVVARGLDATLALDHRLNSRHKLLLTANYSYNRAENRTSRQSDSYANQIAYTPVHQSGCSLGWDNPWLSLVVHGYGMSHRWTTNEHYEGTRVAGFSEFGATAHRKFQLGRHTVEARLDLKNLLDEQYEIVGHYPMPGRSYQFSITYKL